MDCLQLSSLMDTFSWLGIDLLFLYFLPVNCSFLWGPRLKSVLCYFFLHLSLPPICIRWFPNLYLNTNFLSCAPVLHLLLPEWHEHIHILPPIQAKSGTNCTYLLNHHPVIFPIIKTTIRLRTWSISSILLPYS